MALCSGLSLEAQSDKAAVSPGATLRVNFTAIQRLPSQVALTGIRLTRHGRRAHGEPGAHRFS